MIAAPSLQRRILRHILAAAALTVALAIVLTSYFAWQQETQRVRALSTQTLESLSIALTEAVWAVDVRQSENLLQSALKTDGVVRAELRTLTGQTYRYATPTVHGEYLARSAPLVHGGQSLGVLEIAVSNDVMIDELIHRITRLIISALLFVGLFGGLSYLTIRRAIVTPLRQLAARIAANEPGSVITLEADAGRASHELQQLLGAFNAMQAEIAAHLLNERELREQLAVQARKALRESEDKLQALYELAPLGIALTDMAGRYIDFNEAFRQISGYPADELRQIDYWQLTPPEYAEQETRQLETLARTGRYGPYEKEYLRKDGRRIPLRLNGMLMTGKDGRQYIWSIVEDITTSRAAAEQLLAAKLAAEAANQAKSSFLATMSHEIRTPMNGVLGMAQLLLMPGLSEDERQDAARIILNSGKTLLTLLDDILDLSKIEAGRFELVPGVFSPQGLINETLALFSELAANKGLHIEAVWHGAVEARYQGDQTRLRQMLSNLVSNAVKFTERGFVRIEARPVVLADGLSELEFAVTDSGIGIAADKQALLFQPFSQLDDSSTRPYGGTGLGLSIVSSLVRLMGGEFGVMSEPGQQARFWFRIPAPLLSAGDESRQAPRQALPGNGVPNGSTGQVLVVEDNQTNRMVLTMLLGKLGAQVDIVENGEQALAAITAGAHPDIVLMDIQMPVMDGLEATRRIRRWEQDNQRPPRPIVALTAGAFAEDREQCMAAGMDDFLTKPVSIEQLRRVLSTWVKPPAIL